MSRPLAMEALDIWGSRWSVLDVRPTSHGWDLLLGKPDPAGRCGITTIITPALAAYLETRRYPARGYDLPLGTTAIKRLRRVLGHSMRADHAAWWEERIADLLDLTLEQFAARHGVKPTVVERARLALIGRVIRPAGWWRESGTAALLLSDAPRAAIAQELGISVGAVGRLRWELRAQA